MVSKYALFVRFDSCNTKRGELAGVLAAYPRDDRRFIVCKSEDEIPKGSKLNLVELMTKFPDTSTIVQDKNGEDQTAITKGYFHVEGRSSESECPVITEGDLWTK